ncbi:protein M7-like [Tripterygium wilfordii]|uniref:Protein M7-like n=1 Tax=Tripterygium wilfordii TaxID=458696 RepID=A0A7J7CQM1_TRIWF|nr:protein M7-like [Tripterygium wilfordii]
MKLVHSKALPLLVFLLVMTCYVERGRGTACTSTFFSALVQLIPCRAAVAPFSPIPPSETCCNAVKTLGQPCLCVLVNGPPITGVDRNMALQLPDKCTANFEPSNGKDEETRTQLPWLVDSEGKNRMRPVCILSTTPNDKLEKHNHRLQYMMPWRRVRVIYQVGGQAGKCKS